MYTVNRIGCVWEEILVTGDSWGFGLEPPAQSQGFDRDLGKGTRRRGGRQGGGRERGGKGGRRGEGEPPVRGGGGSANREPGSYMPAMIQIHLRRILYEVPPCLQVAYKFAAL